MVMSNLQKTKLNGFFGAGKKLGLGMKKIRVTPIQVVKNHKN